MTKRRLKPNMVLPGSVLRMGGQVKLGGFPLTVVSDQVGDQAGEDADMVVCMPADFPSLFDDDVTTPCAQCGQTIIHRPHVPKRPAKVCIECALPLAGPVAGHA